VGSAAAGLLARAAAGTSAATSANASARAGGGIARARAARSGALATGILRRSRRVSARSLRADLRARLLRRAFVRRRCIAFCATAECQSRRERKEPSVAELVHRVILLETAIRL
jgi:hypothetical protein